MLSDLDLSLYDTDKSVEYLRNYSREIGHLQDRPIKLLELGIRRGGSLLLWRDLFPKATIVGLDIDEIEVRDATGRVHVYQGYQQDLTTLDRIAADVAPDGFDLIIDDASHIGKYTAESFWHLFPRHLKHGGIYVLEDWSCGYWGGWPDGHAFSGDTKSLGPVQEDPHRSSSTARRSELVRRTIRARARTWSARLADRPVLRARLERAYLWAEGRSMKHRFASHDHGMVGFVKQLIDACAVDVIRHGDPQPNLGSQVRMIESVTVNPSQVFVHKVAHASG